MRGYDSENPEIWPSLIFISYLSVYMQDLKIPVLLWTKYEKFLWPIEFYVYETYRFFICLSYAFCWILDRVKFYNHIHVSLIAVYEKSSNFRQLSVVGIGVSLGLNIVIGVPLGLNTMVVLLYMIPQGSHLGTNKSIAWLSLTDSFCSILQIIDSMRSFYCFIVTSQLFWKFINMSV